MSYILEALRKSERERSLGKVPTLTAASQAAAPRRSLVWLLVLLAIIFGGVIWWLWQAWTWTTNPVLTSPVNATTAERGVTNTPLLEGGNNGGTTAGSETVVNGTSSRVTTRDPGAITINVISWSDDPARRFAMINQKIVREGEVLSDGVSVQTIAPNKVIVVANGRQLTLKP